MFNFEQALEMVRAVVRERDRLAEGRYVSVILEDTAKATSFGWIFQSVNEAFAKSRNLNDLAVGTSSFLFNKETGEIRRFAGKTWEDMELAYEKELEAGKGSWCIGLRNPQDLKKAAIAAKTVFGLTPKESLSLFSAPSFLIGRGSWESMRRLQEIFARSGVDLEVRVEQAGFAHLPEYVPVSISGVRNMKTNKSYYP